ncbi:MAG: hypothetical protein ACLPTZ_20980 [Beijerinckiaceae bacterium]|jgi:hypothetical protein
MAASANKKQRVIFLSLQRPLAAVLCDFSDALDGLLVLPLDFFGYRTFWLLAYTSFTNSGNITARTVVEIDAKHDLRDGVSRLGMGLFNAKRYSP